MANALGPEVLRMIHRWSTPVTRHALETALEWKHPLRHPFPDPHCVRERAKTFPNLLEVKRQHAKIIGKFDVTICIPLPSGSWYRIEISTRQPQLWKKTTKKKKVTWKLTRRWRIRGHFIKLAVQVDTPDHFLRHQCHEICVTYYHGQLRETQRSHIGSLVDVNVFRYRTIVDGARNARAWDTRMTDASFIPLEKTELPRPGGGELVGLETL